MAEKSYMINDDKLIFENYIDGITRTKNALGGHIMSMVKHGIPSKEEFIKIRQELHDKVNEIKARGTPATEEERLRGQEIIAKIKNYRSQHPNDPPAYNQEENAETLHCGYAAKGCKCNECEECRANQKEENAEDKPSFSYDAMNHLAQAAQQINKILQSNSDDEARPEHIEKMAEIILGPQSEYASVDHYNKALQGVIELLNRYVVVSMN